MDDVPLRLLSLHELEPGDYVVYVYLSKKSSGDPYTQSVSSSFTWAVTIPPSDIEVPAGAAARLVIESRFDLLPRLFRAPNIGVQQESLPTSQKVGTSPGVQSEGFEMREATAASLDPVIISLANEQSPQGAMDKHAFEAPLSAEVSSPDLALDSGFVEHDLVEEEEIFEEFGSHKESEEESELHLQGIGGGAVIVGCSADADTADMLHALSQPLKTSNLKVGSESAARGALYLCDTCAAASASGSCNIEGWCVVGTGLESCGRAESLDWVLAPWWRLDAAELEVTTSVVEAGTDMDHGGGIGFVYLVAGDETAVEYVSRIAAWRSLLRDGGVMAGSHYMTRSPQTCQFLALYDSVKDYRTAWLKVFGPEARDKAMHPQSDQEEGYFDSGSESGQAVDSARACGVKDAVDAYVRSEGGWLGVTVEARAKAWYWITSPERCNAVSVGG
mmetsp:Transcript_45139/g.94528  ORF Transcript_45139/g.94528 Transcript_45139/m.94528 type:complete len:447 (+) Transcript_45139:253-1593(+)